MKIIFIVGKLWEQQFPTCGSQLFREQTTLLLVSPKTIGKHIYLLLFTKIAKLQQWKSHKNNFMTAVTTAWTTISNGHSIRKGGNHYFWGTTLTTVNSVSQPHTIDPQNLFDVFTFKSLLMSLFHSSDSNHGFIWKLVSLEFCYFLYSSKK